MATLLSKGGHDSPRRDLVPFPLGFSLIRYAKCLFFIYHPANFLKCLQNVQIDLKTKEIDQKMLHLRNPQNIMLRNIYARENLCWGIE